MAFDDELGFDPSQPISQDYTLSATGIVSRTLSLWLRKIVQYIIIVGVISSVLLAVSYVLLAVFFGTTGVLGTDPITYVINLFAYATLPDIALISISMGFAIIAFVVNAILGGAAIKFTLDEYGEGRGDIGASFSHALGRAPTFIIAQLILSFIVGIILTPASILTIRAMEQIDISDPFNPVFPPGSIELLATAMGLFVLGGIFLLYIQTRLAATLGVVIDTELSAIESLKKSWELTSGNFLHVFGSVILLNLLVIVFGLAVSAVVAFTFLPVSTLIVIESIITSLLFSAMTFIFTVVLYRDLSSRKGTSDLPDYVM